MRHVYHGKSAKGNMVNNKIQALVACQKGKQHRSSLIRAFPVCYSDKISK